MTGQVALRGYQREWLRPDEIGFISMWGEGERKRAVESPSADANRNWFAGKR